MPKKARKKAPEPQAADDGVPRCHWAAHPCSERSRAYHDEIWGTPLCDDQALFEQLSLCSQQCGLSWSVIWNKRSDYQQAFHGFDMQRVAAMRISVLKYGSLSRVAAGNPSIQAWWIRRVSLSDVLSLIMYSNRHAALRIFCVHT